jgi:hypothetical protein
VKKIVSFIIIAGCTDAEVAQWGSLGSSGHITCYSGGAVIYDGQSSGKIFSESSSDGWYFNDAKTNRLVRVSGDCVIKN